MSVYIKVHKHKDFNMSVYIKIHKHKAFNIFCLYKDPQTQSF